MVYVLNTDIVISDFKFQAGYYIHFRVDII